MELMLNEYTLRGNLCTAGRRLAEKGLVHSNLGTISAVLDKNTKVYLTKPGPLNYLDALPQDFVLVGIAGNILEPKKTGPSLNWMVHSACYQVRPDIGAVVHAHPRSVVALISQSNERFAPSGLFTFRLLTEEATWFLKPAAGAEPIIPIVPNLDPSELATAVAEKITKGNIVAIRNHGIIAVGASIQEATAAAMVVEEEASLILSICQMGGYPLFLSKERIRAGVSGMPPWFSKPFNPQVPY